MTDERTTILVSLEEVDLLALRPLTRVRYTAQAVEKAERALHRARLAHGDAILDARKAGHSLAQIGQALGVTRQRIEQLVRWREEQAKETQGGKRQHHKTPE